MEDSVIELKNIGERLTSIVSVEHYALGLLKMLETHTQKEIANYVGVSPAKLSPIIQILSDMYVYNPCVIVRYIKHRHSDSYYFLVGSCELETNNEFIDIFKFNFEVLTKVFEDLNIDGNPLVNTYFKVAKLPQITIDALHNLEYKYKA